MKAITVQSVVGGERMNRSGHVFYDNGSCCDTIRVVLVDTDYKYKRKGSKGWICVIKEWVPYRTHGHTRGPQFEWKMSVARRFAKEYAVEQGLQVI